MKQSQNGSVSSKLRDALKKLFMPTGYSSDTWDAQKYANDKPNVKIWNKIYNMAGYKDEKDAVLLFEKKLDQYLEAKNSQLELTNDRVDNAVSNVEEFSRPIVPKKSADTSVSK